MTEPATLRVFLAVPADPAWVESARELLAQQRRELPDASWTKPESWHVTLRFAGEISAEAVRRFADGVAERAAATPGGDLVASGAVVFPPKGPARVLAVGFAATAFTDALGVLAPSIQNPKSKIKNRFHPHVTFARLRRPWPREAVERYRAALSAWRPPSWRARSCVLFQSRLDPAGAVHTPLASWSLAGTPVEVEASR